jgi:hypothetical protein
MECAVWKKPPAERQVADKPLRIMITGHDAGAGKYVWWLHDTHTAR